MSQSEVLVLVTGSIAAYKSCHVVSRLVQAGCNVQVAASPAALQFIGAATWEGLSGLPVVSDLWEPGRAMDHIHLVRKADVILVAPATAHFINRAAYGVGDDLLTTMFLAHDFKKPFLMAPAMNTAMYLHPATQGSLAKLREMGVQILETAAGVLACGENGFGRLLEPDLIVQETLQALKLPTVEKTAKMSPRKPGKILITAGGTREPIDDVRFITNTSTGASGARLADQLCELGHEVTLLRAKSAVQPKVLDVQQAEYETFDDLEHQLKGLLSATEYSHIIHAAAISDYHVEKILFDGAPVLKKKTPSGGKVSIELTPNPKLISSLKTWSKNKALKVAGFKLTSHASREEQAAAASKVLAFADIVVGNDISEIADEKGVHPYRIWQKGDCLPLSGLAELTGWLANWIADGGPQ